MKVSVIIPVYNRNDLLQETLTSLTNQSLGRDDFEVIVCDDGSSMDTLSIVKKFESKLNLYYIYQRDQGFRAGASRNLGADLASGEVLVFLDTGIVLGSEALARHFAHHVQSAQPTAFLGNIYGFDRLNENRATLEKMQVNGRDVDDWVKKLGQQQMFDARQPLFEKYGLDLRRWSAPWIIFWVGHSSIPRQNFLELGGFDESFDGWGYEDIDLGIRWYESGHEIIFAPDIVSIHLPHDKFKEQLSAEEQLHYSNIRKSKLFEKHHLPEIKQWMTMSTDQIKQC